MAIPVEQIDRDHEQHAHERFVHGLNRMASHYEDMAERLRKIAMNSEGQAVYDHEAHIADANVKGHVLLAGQAMHAVAWGNANAGPDTVVEAARLYDEAVTLRVLREAGAERVEREQPSD